MKELPVNQIICGDCLEVMKGFPDESIDMVMFSPPYLGLRDYGVEGQIGLETHPNHYIAKMVGVCKEVRRVLKKSGSMYINLGDTYFGSGMGTGKTNQGPSGKQIYQLPYGSCKTRSSRKKHSNWLQPKQKMMIPARVAIALQDDGWTLRNDIIWHKPNHMPSSVKDRLTSSYEHIFHFVKAKRYYYDLDAIREPHKTPKEMKKYYTEARIKKAKRFRRRESQFQVAPLESPHRQSKDKLKPIRKEDVFPGEDKNPQPGGRSHFGVGSVISDRYKNAEVRGNLKGKNPGDVLKVPYSVQPRLKDFVEVRNLPPMNELKDYLNKWRKKRGYTIEQVEVELKSQAPHHWFNGESHPTKEDWLRIKELLQFDDKYDKQIMEVFLRPAEKQNNPKGANPGDVIKHDIAVGRVGNFSYTDPLHVKAYSDKGKNPADVIKIGMHHGSSLTKGRATHYEGQLIQDDPRGKNPSDFWSINTKPFKGAHFAVYPEAICEKPIKSSCPQNGIVLDLMCGSGTTCVVAKKLGRKYIGIELNSEYVEIAKARLSAIPEKLAKFLEVENHADEGE